MGEGDDMNDERREVLDRLGQAFPRNAIKQRTGGGGKKLDYIETHSVIHRLNDAAHEWSFHVKSMDVQTTENDRGDKSSLWIVVGELTIPGLGTRTGIGVQRTTERGGEDLVKGAASDALKKAATLFGVGLELYGPDYEEHESATEPQRRPQPKRAGPKSDEGTGPHHRAPRKDTIAVYNKAIEANWSHRHLVAWLAAHEVPGDGMDAMNHLTNNQVSELSRDIINKRRPALPEDAELENAPA